MYITNPYTERREEFRATTLGEMEEKISRLRTVTPTWGKMPIEARVSALTAVWNRLQANRTEFERAITEDMGKPIRWSRLEVDRSLDEFRYQIDHAQKWLEPSPMPEGATGSAIQGYVRYDPLGMVAVVSPWNFPVLIPLRGIVPALLTGNTVVFKPSELTLRVGKLLTSFFEELIDPCPVVGIYGDRDLGEAVVQLPVSLIAFTGSTETGKKIASVAAQSMKRCVFELGGLDAAIVLADADIEATAKELVLRNTLNSGQTCSAIKRAFIHRSIIDEVIARVKEIEDTLVLGDPSNETTDIGPLASERQLQRVQSFVADAKGKGTKVIRGGNRPERVGYFFEPTIVTQIPTDARLLSEEPFGPVLPIVSFDTHEEAIARANETRYGLMASIFSRDIEQAKEMARFLEAGTVCINCHFPGGPGTPFGGVKESGIGRIRTREALHEYTNVKFVKG